MVSLAIDPSTSINSAVANGILSSDPSNFILVAEGAWVLTSAPAFDAILLNNAAAQNVLSIDGTVGAINGAEAINVAGGATIVIGEAGYVSGTDGIILGLASDITNAGTILGIFNGIGLAGVNNVVTNTGLIRGTLEAGLEFFSLVGGVNTVVNSGTISGGLWAINCGLQDDSITNTGLLSGAVFLGNGSNVLTNDGEITDLIAGGTSSDTVTNRGVIASFLLLGNGSNTVTNYGMIANGIVGGTGTDTVANHGSVSGEIDLGDGANIYDGTGGTLNGILSMGTGNDIVIGGDGTERVDSGFGADTVSLGGGDDTFIANGGGDGDDVINGGDGGDTYDATIAGAAVIIDLNEGSASGTSIGNDLLDSIENATGSTFADTLTGDDFANILKGLNGDDILTGGAGKDTLDGGGGKDTLTGGAARDLLYGGGADGAVDTFDFNAVIESGITGGTHDVIMDFEDGFDKIDLSTIDAKTFLQGNQAFTFITGAFTSAGGQVRAFVNAHGNTVIQINNDHDTAAEMSIVVHGTPTLTAADFIL